MTDTTKPIEVTAGTLGAQLAALGRYLVTAGGSFALGRGWIDGDALQFFTGLATVAGPAAWGIWRAYANKTALITVVGDPRTPDAVGRVV